MNPLFFWRSGFGAAMVLGPLKLSPGALRNVSLILFHSLLFIVLLFDNLQRPGDRGIFARQTNDAIFSILAA